MEEVKLLKIDGGYVYAPEQYWNFEECEEETLYVFKEDELSSSNKMYLNALRIIKDRSRQQIEKSKADEHGYRFLRANIRNYKKTNYNAWLIKKETPYSVNMGVKLVNFLIVQDLYEYYNYVFDQSDHDKVHPGGYWIPENIMEWH